MKVPVAGQVVGAEEISAGCRAICSGNWAGNVETATFECRAAAYIGVRSAMLLNSGSSANLCAVAALTSPLLEDRALRPGDEAILCAASFSTTAAPVVQNGLTPVFVDATLPTFQVDVSKIADAITPKTRLLMLSHTLGNCFDLDAVLALVREHGLWLIEDNCDALGATWRGRLTGSFGHFSTLSLYGAHHLCAGEGGVLFTNNPKLARIAQSFASWGRDCWCAPGVSDTCGKRFCWQLGELPHGTDHKHVYQHIGYNLKATEVQAAIASEQLKRIDGFVDARRRNFQVIRDALQELDRYLCLPEPTLGCSPSWFGFPVCVLQGSCWLLVEHLQAQGVDTRPIFGGNLTRHPAYIRWRKELPVADRLTEGGFWVGVWPGLTEEQLAHVIQSFRSFFHPGTSGRSQPSRQLHPSP